MMELALVTLGLMGAVFAVVVLFVIPMGLAMVVLTPFIRWVCNR